MECASSVSLVIYELFGENALLLDSCGIIEVIFTKYQSILLWCLI